jgi:DNA repair exonuclease SbcCD ATPase subunit
MAGKKDVVAQVKLQFHNTNNVKVVCTRSLQLSIARNGARKQSTLDGQMQIQTPEGERVAISSRCAELDIQMPISLGVSKAVLENVIFCHQEDSFWPLSEPGPLKKKFDDIFENARYTRALTELKDLKKNQDRDVKADTQALEFMKADKERADRVRGPMGGVDGRLPRILRFCWRRFRRSRTESIYSKRKSTTIKKKRRNSSKHHKHSNKPSRNLNSSKRKSLTPTKR